MGLLLGVDAGGNTTVLVLADQTGQVLGVGQAAGGSRIGWQAVTHAARVLEGWGRHTLLVIDAVYGAAAQIRGEVSDAFKERQLASFTAKAKEAEDK